MAIKTGDGEDIVVAARGQFGAVLDVNLGRGDDTFNVWGSTFDGDVKANGGDGSNTLNNAGTCSPTAGQQCNTVNAGFETRNF